MKSNPILFLFLILVFFSGLYVYATKRLDAFTLMQEDTKESMTDMNGVKTPLTDKNVPISSCPTLLVKQGNVLMLYNPKEPQTESNPLPFYNLEEYLNYLEIQRKKGIHCPVLFLQQENDVQGNDVYRIRPSPTDMQGGTSYSPNNVLPNPPNQIAQQIQNPLPILDASRDMPPYNQGNYAGFDPMGLSQGQYTVIDKVHDSTGENSVSPNPADTNWGGVQYTQKLIDNGVYVENNVEVPHLIDASRMR